MNVFAKFDAIPLMILEVIKETKRYGHTVGRSDNEKTVYPPLKTVCGGYKNVASSPIRLAPCADVTNIKPHFKCFQQNYT